MDVINLGLGDIWNWDATNRLFQCLEFSNAARSSMAHRSNTRYAGAECVVWCKAERNQAREACRGNQQKASSAIHRRHISGEERRERIMLIVTNSTTLYYLSFMLVLHPNIPRCSSDPCSYSLIPASTLPLTNWWTVLPVVTMQLHSVEQPSLPRPWYRRKLKLYEGNMSWPSPPGMRHVSKAIWRAWWLRSRRRCRVDAWARRAEHHSSVYCLLHRALLPIDWSRFTGPDPCSFFIRSSVARGFWNLNE
jgi:hypothetical protein